MPLTPGRAPSAASDLSQAAADGHRTDASSEQDDPVAWPVSVSDHGCQSNGPSVLDDDEASRSCPLPPAAAAPLPPAALAAHAWTPPTPSGPAVPHAHVSVRHAGPDHRQPHIQFKPAASYASAYLRSVMADDGVDGSAAPTPSRIPTDPHPDPAASAWLPSSPFPSPYHPPATQRAEQPPSRPPQEQALQQQQLQQQQPLPLSTPQPPPPRVRLGSLPMRRRVSAAQGALKLPRGLASCVIREDCVYPPANAEVTLEVRESTVRHGRRLLRYSASRPLDTIFVKIPNVHPSTLSRPILESLRHTIELGSQRIIVGAAIRPGCTLLTLDLMCEPWVGAAAGAAAPPAAPSDAAHRHEDASVRHDEPLWLQALAARAGGMGGAAALASQLSRLLYGLGLTPEGGAGVQLQYGGNVWKAVYDTGGGAWDLVPLRDAGSGGSAGAADGGGGATDALPGTDATAADAAGEARSGAGPAAGLASAPDAEDQQMRRTTARMGLAQQVLVAPSSVSEAVHMAVRVYGLADLAAADDGAVGAATAADAGGEEGGVGGGGGPMGRYSFVLRALGRVLPLLGVPAPVTPVLNTVDSMPNSFMPGRSNSTGDGLLSGFSDAYVSSGGGALDSQARGARRTAQEADEEEDDQAAAAAATGSPAAVRQSSRRRGLQRVVSCNLQQHAASTPSANVRAAAEAVAAVPTERASRRTSVDGALAVCHYDLTVTGLGAGRGGGGARPLLMELELWRGGVMLASKPLLLLPPADAAAAGPLQWLVSGVAAAEAGEAADGDGDGPNVVRPDDGGADQLVRDLGLWMEFVDDAVREGEGAHAPAAAAAPQRDRAGGGGAALLPGSLDLREELLAARRRQPAYGAAMLAVGLDLLAAGVRYGSAALAERVMYDMRVLGYGVPEVWRAVHGGAEEEGDGSGAGTLLHAAAAAGDMELLQRVAAWAGAAAEAQEGGTAVAAWRARDVAGRTPLHVLAEAGDGGLMEWALARGEGVRRMWAEARDGAGRTPAQCAERAGAAALQSTAAVECDAAAAGAAGGVGAATAAGSRSATTDAYGGGTCAAVHALPAAATAGTQTRAACGAPPPPPSLRHRHRSLLFSCFLGFDATPTLPPPSAPPATSSPSQPSRAPSPASEEARYQAFLTARTLPLCRAWALLHLVLLASACRRLLADGRPQDLPAALLFSSGYIVLAAALKLAPGSYPAARSAWWLAVGGARACSKLPQLAGWVTTPPATLRYVRAGATLVSAAVLPALFEPLPMRVALPLLMYDMAITAAFYAHIGYRRTLAGSWAAAGAKGTLALAIRLAVDAWHRAAFRRASAAAAADGKKHA